jgi:DNA repair ATPase RecN
MSAADQVWLKQTVERQIEDISADVGEIWEKIGRLECGFEMLISHLDAQTGRLNEQTDKLNELVTAYNNIAGDFRKLCNLLRKLSELVALLEKARAKARELGLIGVEGEP